MSFCARCGSYFEGRGSLCARHSPMHFSNDESHRYAVQAYVQKPHRSGRRSRSVDGHRELRHIKQYDTYGYRPRHRTNDELALITLPSPHAHHSHQHHEHDNHSSPKTLAKAFNHLTNTHAISSMTLHNTPDGTSTLTITANQNREQCPTCYMWFPDRQHLNVHTWELPSGCEEHGMCFSSDEEAFHGTAWRHDRCFVKGCQSVYRKEGGWKAGVVEKHIKQWHWV